MPIGQNTWLQDSVDWFSGTERISVKSGDFAPNPNSRFSSVSIVAYTAPQGSEGKTILQPSQFHDFRIVEKGWLERVTGTASTWFDCIYKSALSSAVLPIIDQLTPDVIPAQRAVAAWFNGVVGSGVTAARLLSAQELCKFEVVLRDGRAIVAETEARFLFRRLPNFYAGIGVNDKLKTQ